MTEVFIRYTNTVGIEECEVFKTDETKVSLDLRDAASIDLLPLIWCSDLEYLNLRYNRLSEIDLTPLAKCTRLKGLKLNHNLLEQIDLTPVSECRDLQEIVLKNNLLKRVDVSPLFHCPQLQDLQIDSDVSLTADLMLRSIGNWPEVLVDRYHTILWKGR